MEKVALAVALGLAAGVLAGLFGVGGGILFVPTLSLALGLDQLHAQATSLAAMLPVVAVGTWRQTRYGHVRLRSALVLGLAGVAGVVAGGFLAEVLAGRRVGAPLRRARARGGGPACVAGFAPYHVKLQATAAPCCHNQARWWACGALRSH